MKVDIIRKFKWYIVGFIMIVIMLSVGLSFCSWDDLSVQALKAKANTGAYNWSTLLKDEKGQSLGDKPVVGDIVQFGRYWQQKAATGDDMLDPLRWIVVDIDDNNVATLLTEKVVVYGNFWGLNEIPYTYYQNYYQSTLRAWLNSGRDSVVYNETGWALGTVATKESDENWRDDGIGSSFCGTADIQANRGFLDVAFDSLEQSIMVPKNISGIQGHSKNTSADGVKPYLTRNSNDSIIDLVWVPSHKEIFGDTKYDNSIVMDGKPDIQFQYFAIASSSEGASYNLVPTAICYYTEYAHESYTKSSYYNDGQGGRNGSDGTIGGSGVWWWLRSPRPFDYYDMMIVDINGSSNITATRRFDGGVRPAVCVQL